MTSTASSVKLTLENLHQSLQKWKEPYIAKILSSKTDFHMKVQQSRRLTEEQTESFDEEPIPPRYSSSEDDSREEKVQNEHKRHLTAEKSNQNQGRVYEWKYDAEEAFKNFEEVSRMYTDIFSKKLTTKNKKKIEQVEDFRKDEKQLISQIFQEISSDDIASFDAVVNFFETYDLFYYFYNIHPYRLHNIIRDSARVHEDHLTRQQFMDLFLLDRPEISQFWKKTQKKLIYESVLDENVWEDLKMIFQTLDTFGNGQVNIKTLFVKLKSSAFYKELMKTKAIEFNEIGRFYTLQKIFFDLENKVDFEEKVSWELFEEMISNFTHIIEPTIDVIYAKNIQKGIIKRDTNYFMIDAEVLKIIKNIFHRCPKYCNSFVKTKFILFEMLESTSLKPFLSCPARWESAIKKTYLTVENVIKELSKNAPQYLDLDEVLEYFSIKGIRKQKIFGVNYGENQSQIIQSSSDQDEEQRQQRKLKKIKSLGNLKKMKKNNKKNWRVNQVTKFKEFNLYEKKGETIRERKVRKMVQDIKQKEEAELRKKFKANQIPVSLNSEKYLKYQKDMEKKKQMIKNQLALKYEIHENIVDYLKSNTKLFQAKNLKPHCKWYNDEPYTHQIKPLPQNTLEELLPKIEKEKIERREKILEENKKKYEEFYWKDLPIHENPKEDSLLDKLEKIEERKKFEQIKANKVPDFQYLHMKFEEELQRKRKSYKPTEIKQFKITSPKQSKNLTTEEQSEYRSPVRVKSPFSKTSPKVEVKSTQKYDDWISYNQQKIAEVQMQELEKEKEQQERLVKQRNFAKFMKKSFGSYASSQNLLKQKTKEKLKKFKFYMSNLQKQTEKELAEMYARVLQRPFLFEQASTQKRSSEVPSNPTKVLDKAPGNKAKKYEYVQGVFEKDEDEFHPIQSENLNQSF